MSATPRSIGHARPLRDRPGRGGSRPPPPGAGLAGACNGGTSTTLWPWPMHQRSARARTRWPRTRSGSNWSESIHRRTTRSRSGATACRRAKPSARKSETAIRRSALLRHDNSSASCTVAMNGIAAAWAAAAPFAVGSGPWAWIRDTRCARMMRASLPRLRQVAKRPAASSGSGRWVPPAAASSRSSWPPGEATSSPPGWEAEQGAVSTASNSVAKSSLDHPDPIFDGKSSSVSKRCLAAAESGTSSMNSFLTVSPAVSPAGIERP